MRHRAWLLLGLTLLLAVAVRVRLRDMPLERDEGEYAYAGQLILQGVPPYKEVYTMKLPGTYAAYAAIMAVFGQTPAGIHLGVMLVNAGSIVLVFLIGRRLLDDTTGLVAAVSFAVMSASPRVFGLAGHATQFVVLPALGGVLLLLDASEPRRGARGRIAARGAWCGSRLPHAPLFLSGLLFGLAFVMKQHGVFFGLFGALYLLWCHFSESWEARAGQRQLKRLGIRRPPPRQVALPVPATPRLNVIAAKRQAQSQESGAKVEGQGAEPAHAPRPPRHESSPPPASHQASPPTPPRPLLAELGCFTSGFILPYALTCLVFWWAGVFPQFWFWTVSYASRYALDVPEIYSAATLRNALSTVAGPNLGFWLLPWAGALLMWWDERLAQVQSPTPLNRERESKVQSREEVRSQRPEVTHHALVAPQRSEGGSRIRCPRFFLTAFFFCSFASVSVGFYFRPHYFITLLPALALLSGVAVSRCLHLFRNDKSIELLFALPVFLLFVIALGAGLVGHASYWLSMSPAQCLRNTHGSTIFSQTLAAAEYVSTNTTANARIAVLGSEPEIFFYAGRRSASGYIYMYPLMEEQTYALQMQEQAIAEFERARPEFVVLIKDEFSWLRLPRSPTRLDDWWKAQWETNYDLTASYAIEEGFEETTLPGEQKSEPSPPPKTAKYVLVLKRKNA